MKLRATLMLVIQQKVSDKALRTDDLNTVDILVGLIANVNPGGKAEMDGKLEGVHHEARNGSFGERRLRQTNEVAGGEEEEETTRSWRVDYPGLNSRLRHDHR